jgi:hypothetical protein
LLAYTILGISGLAPHWSPFRSGPFLPLQTVVPLICWWTLATVSTGLGFREEVEVAELGG